MFQGQAQNLLLASQFRFGILVYRVWCIRLGIIPDGAVPSESTARGKTADPKSPLALLLICTSKGIRNAGKLTAGKST
jgi:hypothetical protein